MNTDKNTEKETGLKLVRMVNYEANEGKIRDFDEIVKKWDDCTLWTKAEDLVIECIIKNRYRFDGDYHQRGEYGSFVFADDDGEQYIWLESMRGFGGLMADAWNHLDKHYCYDYIDFYMCVHPENDDKYKVPKSETEFLENMEEKHSISPSPASSSS